MTAIAGRMDAPAIGASTLRGDVVPADLAAELARPQDRLPPLAPAADVVDAEGLVDEFARTIRRKTSSANADAFHVADQGAGDD